MTFSRAPFRLALVALVAGAWGCTHEAQRPTADATAGVTLPPPTRSGLLLEGWGSVHWPISHEFEETQQLFDQGMAQLLGRRPREAERSFRQLLAAQPDCAMAHWGVAMATFDTPERAVIAADEAVFYRSRANDDERRFIDALASFYEIDPAAAKTAHWRRWYARPENREKEGSPFRNQNPETLIVEGPPRTFSALFEQRRETFVQDLANAASEPHAQALAIDWHLRNQAIGIRGPWTESLADRIDGVLAAKPNHPVHLQRLILLAATAPREVRNSAAAVAEIAPANGKFWFHAAQVFMELKEMDEAARCLANGLRSDHAHMAKFHLMPYEVPHYGKARIELAELLKSSGRKSHAMQLVRGMTRMPRHPESNPLANPESIAGRSHGWRTGSPSPISDATFTLPGDAPRGPGEWQGVIPRNWILPSADGAPVDFRTFRGKPVMVIFYLGFGCLHCVEQLRNLGPYAPEFRKLGVEVLTIGPDAPTGLRRSVADIEPSDRFDFLMLSDEKMRVFREWLAYDSFNHKGLHGLFLISPKGRILWQDLSDEPFDDPDWLLAETRRILTR